MSGDVPAEMTARLALFTDFDGTLVEIASTPDGVEVPDQLPALLRRLAESFSGALAVLTGRRVADLDGMLGMADLAVAGTHGLERRRADGSFEAPAPELLAGSAAIADALAPLVAGNPALILESKPGAVALHFRQDPEAEQACLDAMAGAVAEVEGFTVLEGRKVVEARPAGLSKGTALRAFMEEAPFRGRLPVCIGDDTTDEDGFAAAQALGGVGIRLGDAPTSARLRIADVASVHALMAGLADLPAGSGTIIARGAAVSP